MPRRVAELLLAAVVTLVPACAGAGGGDTSDDRPAGIEAAASTSTVPATVPPPSTTPPAGPAPVTVDACALLSPEEVTVALGTVVEGHVESEAPLFGCRWESERLDLVSLAVVVYETPETAEEAFDVTRQQGDHPDVEGVGDRAIDASPVYDVTAQRGRFEVSVDVDVAGAHEATLARDLARQALNRLPPG